MVNICTAPSHACMPDLLMLIARSKEFSGICLRRSERKVIKPIHILIEMLYLVQCHVAYRNHEMQVVSLCMNVILCWKV